METSLELYRQLLEDPGPAVLATIVKAEGSTPGKLGFKMLVYADGRKYGTVGGGILEEHVIAAAPEALAEAKPLLKHYSLTEEATGMWCGGEVDVLLEPLAPPAALWIFGYGNLGSEVHGLLAGLPFAPVVIHDQPVPEARSELIDWEQLQPLPTVAAGDYVLLLTLNAELEVEIIAALADAAPRYVGVVGSQTKAGKLRKALAGRGVDIQALNLYCPVGLNIGGKTVKEIAVSIVAELIKECNAA